MSRTEAEPERSVGASPDGADGWYWHSAETEQVYGRLDTSPEGLSSDEAERRLRQHGRNEIETSSEVRPLRILLNQFRSPLIYVLLAATAVTLATGHYTDSAVIAAVLVLNATLGFVQEYRAENAMLELMALVSPRAKAVRDGERVTVQSAELVPGDVVHVESGDFVPADVRLFDTRELRVDESMLTGESEPVEKNTEAVDAAAVVGDRRCLAYMGTAVVSGRGRGVVVATGDNAEIGTIASEIRGVERAVTPLQRRMHGFSNRMSAAILALAVVLVAAGVVRGAEPADIFMLAVAMSVAAIPEGLPIVMTVALAVGVRKMASRNVVVRRLPAVETLGSCTTIVTDKTGTLTENRMTVRRLSLSDGRSYEVTGTGSSVSGDFVLEGGYGAEGDGRGTSADAALRKALETAVLANEADVSVDTDGKVVTQGDPTETALLVAAGKAGVWREDLVSRYPELRQIPFESDRMYGASLHEVDGEGVWFVKGAPERVLEMCADADEDKMREEADSMASEGMRVLAVAAGTDDATEGEPHGLELVGLFGMLDPPRAGVTDSIEACHKAGVRVMMVTGDHASTALAVSKMVGIVEADAGIEDVVTGVEMDAMDDAELTEKLKHGHVFARVSPSQKLRIVSLLRASDEVVAVTGDGVNDAPALKSAHIGAAMGSGTDVAKEASEMVVSDDNFTSVYAAVEEGRTAFSNIRKATHFLLSTSVGVVIAVLAVFVLGAAGVYPAHLGAVPLLMLPAQIIWLNVVTNGIQDIALAFEPGEESQYTAPPRDTDEGLLSYAMAERTAVVGVAMAVVAVVVFTWELDRGSSLAYAQVSTLTALVVFKALHVGTCRSETLGVLEKDPFSNRVLFLGSATALAVHVGALYWSGTQAVLSFEPLTGTSWVVVFLLAPIAVVVTELHKKLR